MVDLIFIFFVYISADCADQRLNLVKKNLEEEETVKGQLIRMSVLTVVSFVI